MEMPSFNETCLLSPADYAWSGAQFLASVDDGARLQNKLVTRKEYLEHGSDICRIKFGSF
jgi:actin-related protein 6